VTTNVTVKFPVCGNHYVSCPPMILHAVTNSVYPLGLVVLIPQWGNSRDSIHAGDRVSLRVNKQGLIALTVVQTNGTARTRFEPVILVAPRGGYRYLWVQTKTHGWQRISVWKRVANGYAVTQPGVYKWTRR
jgi:hypothetical protein